MAGSNYIFLSYSHHGKSIEPYITKIEDAGYHVVYDEDISFGELWNRKVRRQINNPRCKGLLLFLTEQAAVSDPILTEMEYARSYSKPVVAVVLQHSSPQEIFEKAAENANEDERFTVQSIADFFPHNKLFLRQDEIDLEQNTKLRNTFESWGFFPDIENKSGFTASTYSSEIEGEKERLKWQADGYTEFDKEAIDKAVSKIGRKGLIVLDIGCSNGYVTYTRFADNPDIAKVIGVDYNQKDIDEAIRLYGENGKFSFYNVDLDSSTFLDDIRAILREENANGVDIVFAAFIMQHVKDPKVLLLRLFDVLNANGKVIIRESDDGCKVGYPSDELSAEIINRTNKIIKSSDRDFGRKLYPYLNELGYNDIELMYQITDTIGKSRKEKEWLFTMGFGFRLNRIKSILSENPDNDFLLKECRWLEEALKKLRIAFYSRGYYYSARAFIAIASE